MTNVRGGSRPCLATSLRVPSTGGHFFATGLCQPLRLSKGVRECIVVDVA